MISLGGLGELTSAPWALAYPFVKWALFSTCYNLHTKIFLKIKKEDKINLVTSKGLRIGKSCAGTLVSSEACESKSDLGVNMTTIYISCEYWGKSPNFAKPASRGETNVQCCFKNCGKHVRCLANKWQLRGLILLFLIPCQGLGRHEGNSSAHPCLAVEPADL